MGSGSSRRMELRRGWIGIMVSAAMFFFFSSPSHADNAAFDLAGPPIEMRVTRAGKTLPISEVPNLQAGDRVWVQTELPKDQSVHYLLVAGFLQGPTNPPPEKWFSQAETWDKHFRQEGIVITVPRGAQQALLMLAPETGGGFSAVRNAVRSKPGVFVRAARDLDRVSLQKARLDAYFDTVKSTPQSDAEALKKRSALAARALSVRLDQDCFNQPPDQQESCLVQGSDQLLLQDGSQSMVASLTTGPSADLIGAVSSTPIARSGYYSPYIGSVVDLVRIMGSLHSPNYVYIPALSIPNKDQLNLRLNAPPSFHNPKSVLVVGLPPVQQTRPPEIRALDPKQVYCLSKSSLVLPVSGAPLVFATQLGHDFFLDVKDKTGKELRLPAIPDAKRGGFVVDTSSLAPGEVNTGLDGTLEGSWGFQSFKGPTFHFRISERANWPVPKTEKYSLVVGRNNTLNLQSSAAVCVQNISMQYASETPASLKWKTSGANELQIDLPLDDKTAGPFKIIVAQYGLSKPDTIELRAYADEAALQGFRIHAGDSNGILTGSRLDEVANLQLGGIKFAPDGSSPAADDAGELKFTAENLRAAQALHATTRITAQITLKDGRVLELATTIEPPRPKLMLADVSVASGPAASFLHLGNSHELPQNGRLVFALKSEIPAEFPRTEKVEVASLDGASHALLSVDRGSLIPQGPAEVIATLEPLKALGPSIFGPLQFRPVAGDGSKGDWQPLATLVRIPLLKEVQCPASADSSCTLTGQNLYLIESVASNPSFSNSIPVPFGYAGNKLSVPRPDGTLLYIKLRDDPSTVDSVALPVLPEASE